MLENMFTMPIWVNEFSLNYQWVMFFVIFFSLWGWDTWNDVIRSANGIQIEIGDTAVGFMLSFIVAAFVSSTWPHVWPLYIVSVALIGFFIIIKKSAKVTLLGGVRKK